MFLRRLLFVLAISTLSAACEAPEALPDEDLGEDADPLRGGRKHRPDAAPAPTPPDAASAAGPDAAAPPVTGAEDYLLFSRAELLSLPTSGAAWDTVMANARTVLVADLVDQNNLSPADAFAAGLVYARTGDVAMRDKVITALRALPETENTARTLSVGRQMSGWILAADLVGYRDAAFVAWVSALRDEVLPLSNSRWQTLAMTAEDSASNWGAFSLASLIAIDRYLGDADDLAIRVQIFKGWMGDRAQWTTWPVGTRGAGGFQPTAAFDSTWACAYPAWSPLNGGCTAAKDGLLVEDISRSAGAFPTSDETGHMYVWETLQGLTLSALLLEHGGVSDVWGLGSNGLARAWTALARQSGGRTGVYSVDKWVPWLLDRKYGTSYATAAAGHGRNFGFTDWLRPIL